MSVEQMAKATRGLPEFQELSKKMAQHVRLSQECMDKVLCCAVLPFFISSSMQSRLFFFC